MNWEQRQRELCARVGAPFVGAPFDQKTGVARNLRTTLLPINGLRHPPEGDTTGWYLWAGEEFSSSPDFFEPLHTEHLVEWRPEVIKYLGLPPGWRFLIAQDYEDIWYDPSLIISDKK
jgi:hypothetical protein